MLEPESEKKFERSIQSLRKYPDPQGYTASEISTEIQSNHDVEHNSSLRDVTLHEAVVNVANQINVRGKVQSFVSL